MLKALLALLPRNRGEFLEFLLDLSPAIGILVFRDDPRKLFLLLGLELLCLEGFIAIRLLVHGFGRIVHQLRELGFYNPLREALEVLGRLFLLIPLSAALALLGALLAVNYLPFILIESFLMAAATHDPDPRGHLLLLVRKLSPADATAMCLLVAPFARRYLLRLKDFLVRFVREKDWTSSHWGWVVLSLPPVRFERIFPRDLLGPMSDFVSFLTSVFGVISLAVIPFVLLRLFALAGGFLLILLAKAFGEMWLERVLRAQKSGDGSP